MRLHMGTKLKQNRTRLYTPETVNDSLFAYVDDIHAALSPRQYSHTLRVRIGYIKGGVFTYFRQLIGSRQYAGLWSVQWPTYTHTLLLLCR